MKFESLSPVLYTRLIQETIDFYWDILGFTCKDYEPNWGWASLTKGPIRIMISLPNAHLPYDHLHLPVHSISKPMTSINFILLPKTESIYVILSKISNTACVNLPFGTTTDIYCNLAKASINLSSLSS
jgi:hypothetical protein